ncbi:hypothetical protein MUG91_G27n125 [Manis pentadactyla]|nr:hypothetical protein MUG91_G27n125 [Manis pentadactyla]
MASAVPQDAGKKAAALFHEDLLGGHKELFPEKENVSSQLTDSMLSSSAEHCARDTGPGCPCKQTAQGHPRSAPPLGPLQISPTGPKHWHNR